MTDIYIITNYYPPETGAASNRIFHLAEGLQKHSFNVSVITPLPNYPSGKIFKDYKGKFKHVSTKNGINIYRLWVYANNSKNKLLRLFAMLSYSFSLVWFFLWNKIPKTIIIQSPPLLVAFTSILFLRSKKRKLILNVSDLWPIAGLELGALKKNISYKILEKIERFNYKNADLILVQSEEIITHVKSIFPKKNTFLYRNYPDFLPLEIKYKKNSKKPLTIVYAGLLGVAQGVFKLCEKLDYNNIQFHIYGNGAEKEKIEAFVNNNPSLPVFYHGEIARGKLHKALLQYDVTIIPLVNRIYGSVPSKIYEYARLGLPIIYFGGGEGETIIKNNQLGWVAEAGNYDDLNTVINEVTLFNIDVELKKKIKETAYKNFNFSTQLKKLIKKI